MKAEKVITTKINQRRGEESRVSFTSIFTTFYFGLLVRKDKNLSQILLNRENNPEFPARTS